MNDHEIHDQFRSRMLQRITDMESGVSDHLPTTDALFTATSRLRDQLMEQREDAHTWAALLETGPEHEEALAEHLIDYRDSLDAGLDADHPAPHYQATVSALDQRLEPDQLETVMGSEAMQHCADASLETALASGNELLTTGQAGDQPSRYRDHKRSWDLECSAGSHGEKLYGYTPMAPVKEQVENVLSDQQLIEHKQRQIDAAMIGHLPSAQRLGVDVMQRQAAEIYAAPMIDHRHPGREPDTVAAVTPTTHLNPDQQQVNPDQQAGPSLG